MLAFPETLEVGLDECGRGCLAGPVVAAAVIWDPVWLAQNEHIYPRELALIKDSKKLSLNNRKKCEAFIQKHAKAWVIKYVSEKVIDETNILEATFDSMHACLNQLYEQEDSFDFIAVDGNRFRPWKRKSVPFECFVGGDNLRLSIASASILAKVSRDEYMSTLPEASVYDWASNKGYGTAKHIRAIQTHGLCDKHRKSFQLKSLVN
jgi:ribonuclease HII